MEANVQPGQERREQIYDAALVCFGRAGYHQTTMDQVAAESGVSKGTLYWHFKSKQELFLSLFQHIMDDLAARWEAMMAQESGGAADKIRASLGFFRRDVEPLLPVFTVMIETWALIREDQNLAQQARRVFGRFQWGLREILQEGVEEGVFDVDSPNEASFVLMTLVSGLVVRMSSGLWQRNWDAVLDCMGALVLRGLRMQDADGRSVGH